MPNGVGRSTRAAQIMYGRWLIEGYPKVLLFDLGSAWSKLDEWRRDLFATAQIPGPAEDSEMNDAIVFGYLVAWFLGEVRVPAVAPCLWPLWSGTDLCAGRVWRGRVMRHLRHAKSMSTGTPTPR